jgi:uncharacterized membrane protein
MTLLLHIVSGSLALLGGALAYAATKGSPQHRRGGTVFCVAMLVMGLSGSVLAAWQAKPLSLLSGLLVCHLVITGWLTVRRPAWPLRTWLLPCLLGAIAIGIALLALGAGLITPRPGDRGPALVFGAVALVAAALDARLLRAGRISGAHRLARHLWRLGFALLMASTAFFLGQAQLFPQPLRRIDVLALPVLLVLVATLFFGARLWWRSRRPAVAGAGRCG